MSKKFILPLVILTVSITAAVWMWFQKSPPQSLDVTPPVMLVDVVRAKSGTEQITVTAQGSVQPRTESLLVSEVSGLITEVSPAFVAGGFFSRGDLLVRIDDRNYRAEVKRAEASVAAAETNVTREAGLADYAKEDWDRARSIFKSSKAASDLALRKPQLAEALASLEFARADLEKRQGDLDRTIIRAPYDGLIREKRADLGQFVNAGSPVALTFSIDVAEIRLPLPDRELPFLNLDPDELSAGKGPAVTLSANIGGQRHQWSGHLVRTEGVFDERSRVLYVVAQVSDPYNRHDKAWEYPLRIGTFVSAQILGESLPNVIKLPRSVIRGNNRVWTVKKDNTLQPVDVELARADEHSILVTSGLTPGDLVCVTLLDNPMPGTPVRFDKPVAQEIVRLGND
jgi:RND family efflux transporter MFP subunit